MNKDKIKARIAEIQTRREELKALGDKAGDAENAEFAALVEEQKKLRAQLTTLEDSEALDSEGNAVRRAPRAGARFSGEVGDRLSLGAFLQAVAAVGSPDGERSGYTMSKTKARDILFSPRAATGASEAVPSEGGFLVGTEQAAMLASRAYEEGKLAALCDRITISGPFNGLKYPVIDETSRVDGSRSGGVLAYWKNEGAAAVASKPKIREDQLNLEKLTGLFYATDELLQDASALEAMAIAEFGKEFAFKLDDAVLNGSGAGMPLGILNAPGLVSQAKETGQTAATITYENIIKMYSRLWSGASMDKVRWVINREAFPQLMKLAISVGTGGFPLYIPGNSAANAPFGTLLGIPVVFAEQALALGTVGDIYLADFGQYRLIEKGGIQVASSMHVQFVYDEMAFRFIYRVNGQPLWKAPLTPYKGSATVSPFVALATRA